MNFKRYQNEIIVLGAFVFMLAAYAYKNYQVTQQTQNVSEVKYALSELKEALALKKVWSDKKILKKIETLKSTVAGSKVKWSKKGNKLTANYENLTDKELNKLVTKIMNLPIVITLLDIEKIGSSYRVEFKCTW